MKTITKRALSFALALALFAVCFAGMTVMTATADATGGGTPTFTYNSQTYEYAVGNTSLNVTFTSAQFSSLNGIDTFNRSQNINSVSTTHAFFDSTQTATEDNTGSLMLSIPETSTYARWMFWSSTKIVKGRIYQITAKFKGDANTQLRLGFEGRKSGNYVVCSSGWTEYEWICFADQEYDQNSPDRGYAFEVRCNTVNNGKAEAPMNVYVDDIKIQEIVPKDLSIIPENRDEGGYLKFDLLNLNNGENASAFYQICGGHGIFKADTKYTASFDMMSSNLNCWVGFDYGIKNMTGIMSIKASDIGVWQRRYISFTSNSEEDGNVRIYHNSSNTGMVLIDNLIIYDEHGNKVWEDRFDGASPKTEVGLSFGASQVPLAKSAYLSARNNADGGFIKFESRDLASSNGQYGAIKIKITASITADTEYTISFKMLSSDTGISLKFDRYTSGDWDQIISTKVTEANKWEQHSFTYTPGANANTVRFYINIVGDNKKIGQFVLLDDVEIKPSTGTPVYSNDFTTVHTKDNNFNTISDGYTSSEFTFEGKSASYVPYSDIIMMQQNVHSSFLVLNSYDVHSYTFSSAVYTLKNSSGQPLKLTGGKTYTVSYNAMVNRLVQNMNIGFDTGNGIGTVWKMPTNACTWEEISFDFEPTEEALTSNALRIYLNTAIAYGTVALIDDLKIEEGGVTIYEEHFSGQSDATVVSSYTLNCYNFFKHDYSTEEGYDITDTMHHKYLQSVDQCSECKHEFKIYTEAATAHAYDHVYDKDCNVCGYEREVGVCGDVYDDETVDIFDLFILAKYIADVDVSSLYTEANADINVDGEVNQTDLDLFATYWLEHASFKEKDLPIVPAQ